MNYKMFPLMMQAFLRLPKAPKISTLYCEDAVEKIEEKFQTFIRPAKASHQCLTSLNKDFIFRFINLTPCIFKSLCKLCNP